MKYMYLLRIVINVMLLLLVLSHVLGWVRASLIWAHGDDPGESPSEGWDMAEDHTRKSVAPTNWNNSYPNEYPCANHNHGRSRGETNATHKHRI
jgi:hypothetical protein